MNINFNNPQYLSYLLQNNPLIKSVCYIDFYCVNALRILTKLNLIKIHDKIFIYAIVFAYIDVLQL